MDHSDTERLATLLDHTGPGQPFAVRRTAALEAATAFPSDARVGRLVTDWLSDERALFRLTALDMLAAMPGETALELRRKASAGAPGIHAEYDPDPFVRGRLGRWDK
ncbi:MAG: hypothetical protein HKN17_02770 [Rhodothermales bacterium]|nr:hypothetical protein [Rhodothermales bacterium]